MITRLTSKNFIRTPLLETDDSISINDPAYVKAKNQYSSIWRSALGLSPLEIYKAMEDGKQTRESKYILDLAREELLRSVDTEFSRSPKVLRLWTSNAWIDPWDYGFTFYKSLPDSLKGDKELVLLLIKTIGSNRSIFDSIPRYLRNSKEIAVATVKANPYAYNSLDKDFKLDKDIALIALNTYKDGFWNFPMALRKDPEFAIFAVQKDVMLYFALLGAARKDKTVALAAVKKDPKIFYELDNKLKKDPALLAFMQSEGYSTDPSLYNEVNIDENTTPSLVSEKAKRQYNALKAFGLSPLEIYQSTLDNNGQGGETNLVQQMAHKGILDGYRFDRTVNTYDSVTKQSIIDFYHDYIKFPEQLKADKSFILSVLDRFVTPVSFLNILFYRMPESLKNDKEVVSSYISHGADNIYIYLPDALQADPDIIKAIDPSERKHVKGMKKDTNE